MNDLDLAAIRSQIEDFALKFDPVELLLRLSRLSNFVPASDTSHNWTLREMPLLYLLAIICLRNKIEKFAGATPISDELEQIVTLLEQFVIAFNMQQIDLASIPTREVSRPIQYDM